ncbi:MAG: tRNA (5-methylaminomethyl-2-thiouridine)(34)-methyltransferase MnmD [Bacteroidota bacterium]
MERIILQTADLSNTIYVKDLDETFHSVNGALQESNHVFIHAGFDEIIKSKNKINIFEVGFGTGLNALLTFTESSAKNIAVSYTSIEAFPLEKFIVEELSYKNIFDKKYHANIDEIQNANWNETIQLNKNSSLTKVNIKLEEYIFNSTFDLVYFDAFAPDKQPELWTEEIFKNIFNNMNEGGILVTYSAKGEVRRRMQRAGFTVERLPGPKGKREMLRARKLN